MRKDGPSGVIFYDPPRIVGVRPYLNFAAHDAKNTDHYISACRMALLAYAAFPNAYWDSATELRVLDGGEVRGSILIFCIGRPVGRSPESCRGLERLPVICPGAVGICEEEGGKCREIRPKEIRDRDTTGSARLPRNFNMGYLYGRPPAASDDGRLNEGSSEHYA